MSRSDHRVSASSLALILLAVFSIVGCEKQSGEALVLGKEHIDAAPTVAAVTESEHAASPGDTAKIEELPRPMRDDEIAVDQYVMTRDVRGTSRDPRAMKDEQWIMKVRMIYDGRTFNVETDQS